MERDHDECRQIVMMLSEVPGIGWRTIQKAVASGAWREGSGQDEAAYVKAGFSTQQARSAVKRIGQGLVASGSSYEKAVQLGASVITPFDEAYPNYLLQIPQPPWVLYAIGRLELLKRPIIAIVGTRNPTAYGRHTASMLSEQLSAGGMTIASGLARGIDSKAHEAALRGVGSTIAVLACAVDCCYPSENRTLYRHIAEEGLLLSETPIGTPLHPGMFPLRNRIIAGLSLGTLVIEGAIGSGSLITAAQALDMNRDLFAVPGPISSPKSEGPNSLIRQGAKLVSVAEHIFEEYTWLGDEWLKQSNSSAFSQRQSDKELSADERKIIALLRERPLSINELHQLIAVPFGHLSALLINLCIKRRIEQQSGSLYIAL
ncbi:DNA-processing protein DprA [Paenibacillus sp. Leaf72]|uniref:DNA-processing protein DprA n=1 Tax=Paenibacillus sp. Leaf72 TaxID=1736234 RepID=UPI0006F7ACE7|nr:DNA-processing protein DprA [Paenibacillus sp. Leaf72]KQO04432.1 DNA protecting protein DprA [Paenibacillus sp. Leaf72]